MTTIPILYNNFSTWCTANLAYLAGFMVLIAIVFWIAGGFKQAWGKQALSMGWKPVAGVLAFIFFPQIWGIIATIGTTFASGGSNTITHP